MMKKTGFSLIELSITLVIIAILIAGITSGSTLIKNAKINKLVAEISEIKANNQIFSTTYDAIPGDFLDATTFWGTYNATTNPDGAINGNGTDDIEHGTYSRRGEALIVWHHLELAGLISGTYNRTHINQTTGNLFMGIDIPHLQSFHDIGIYYNPSNNPEIGPHLVTGKHRVDIVPANAAFTNKQAYLIDFKIDDGIQNKGTIIGYS